MRKGGGAVERVRAAERARTAGRTRLQRKPLGTGKPADTPKPADKPFPEAAMRAWSSLLGAETAARIREGLSAHRERSFRANPCRYETSHPPCVTVHATDFV
jgi:hypothetical protein